MRDVAGGHVLAGDFLAVEVDYCAVVHHEAQREVVHQRRVCHGEYVAEVAGDATVGRIWAAVDDRRFIAVAVTQLAGAGGPASVVERLGPPLCSLI